MIKNTYDLFSVPIHAQQLNLDNETMAKYCLSLMEKNEGRYATNKGGWQSEDLQGEHQPLNELFLSIENAINDFAYKLKFPKQKIDNIWININGHDDYNSEHRHPNSHFSGVYYIQANDKSGDITFSNPNAPFIEAYWSSAVNVINNDTQLNLTWTMPSETGKLYVFPSWLGHRVLPNKDENFKRISISWNSWID